jgi:hypothetical protein
VAVSVTVALIGIAGSFGEASAAPSIASEDLTFDDDQWTGAASNLQVSPFYLQVEDSSTQGQTPQLQVSTSSEEAAAVSPALGN